MNQLPYTVDVQKDAVVPYQPQIKRDDFMDFFRLAEGRKWCDESTQEAYQEASEKLRLALQVPLREQAVRAAEKLIGAFIQDISCEVVKTVEEFPNETISRIVYLNYRHTEKVDRGIIPFPIYHDRLSPSSVSTTYNEWLGSNLNGGIFAEIPKEYKLLPMENYSGELTLHESMVAAKLTELKIHPQFGKFWIAQNTLAKPDEKPFLYFQVLTYFVCISYHYYR